MNLLLPEKAELLYEKLALVASGEHGLPGDRIRKIRPLLEALFRELIHDETQAFPNLFSASAYIFDRYEVAAELRDEINGLRKLCNKVVHEADFEVYSSQYEASVQVLSKAVEYFSGRPVPEELSQIYAGKNLKGLREARSPRGESIPFVRAVVHGIAARQLSASGTHFCELQLESEDPAFGEFSLRLWDAFGEDSEAWLKFSKAGEWLRPYATLHLMNLRSQPERPGHYSSTAETLLVLEPDYLLEATEMAECFMENRGIVFDNYRLAILGRFVPSEPGLPLVVGQIVNQLLDQLLLDPGAGIADAMRTTLRENVLPAVRIGEDQLKQARSDIERVHYPNLQELANSYQGKSLRIEPTFYSDRYGMQGRLDALIEYPEDPERRDVFELKSGKEPRGHVGPSHKVQVLCYDMLLRSVFSTKRKGNSAIFYSQAASQPLRNVTATRQEEQRLIYLRNRLVSDLFCLTDRNFHLLGDIHPDRFGPRIIYKEAQILQFQEQYESVSALERAYFEEFAAFVLRELRTAKVGDGEENEKAFKGFSALWLDGRETKESSLICGLRFVGADEALETLIFTRDEEEAQATDFREGDIAIIYPQDTNGLFPLRYQILKCSIEKLTDKELHLRLRNRQSDVKALFRRHQQWALEHDLLESNYHELLRSLYQFLSAPERQRKRVLGEVKPAFDPTLPQITDDGGFGGTHNLSPLQREIIRRALSARDFFLIQGPPGTGKTSTILTRIVGHLYRHSEEGIMVLAFTNRAVDEICEKLHSSDVHFVRIGGTRSPFTLQAQTRELNFVQTGKLLRETRVYVATISSFLSRQQELLRIRSFDTLIVDEASQLLEPHLAGPLTQFPRYILIGDQNQLPAVAQQKAATCRNLRPELENAGFADLRTSLFERLWNRCQQQGWHDATGMLEEHYRMHTDVADLINPYYKGKLLCLSPRQKEPLFFPGSPVSPLAELISQHRVLFIESSAVIADKVHSEEAERVIALIAALKELYGDTFDPEKTVGVITPWRKQISQIRAQLPIEFSQVMVDTVERFQGSEREVILLSLAIHHRGQVQALSSPGMYEEVEVDRKLNVALSRARSQVIVLGDPWPLAWSSHYKALMAHIQTKGGYISSTFARNCFPS